MSIGQESIGEVPVASLAVGNSRVATVSTTLGTASLTSTVTSQPLGVKATLGAVTLSSDGSVQQPPAGPSVKVGTFTLNSSVGNQIVSGLGFAPQLVILWVNAVVPNSGANELRHCYGAASGASKQWVYSCSYNGGTNGLTDYQLRAGYVLQWIKTGTDTVVMRTSLVSLDSSGFTLNVDTALAGVVVNYMAVGGSGFTADVGTVLTRTTAGTQAVSTGTDPKALIMVAGPYNDSILTDIAPICFGMSTGSSNSMCLSQNMYYTNDSDAWSKNPSQRDLVHTINQNGDFESRVTLSSFGVGAFTLNYLSAPTTASRWGWIVMGGTCSYDLTALSMPTAIGTSTKSGLTWTPSGLIAMGLGIPASTASVEGVKFCFGAATPAGAYSMGHYLPNANAQTNLPVATAMNKLNFVPGTTSGSTLAEVDVASVQNTGYTLNWAKVLGSAADLMVLSFGSPQKVQFVAPVQGKTTVSGNLSTAIKLAAAVSVKSTVTPALLTSIFRASVLCKSTLAPDLTVNNGTLTLQCRSTVSGSLTTAINLAANVVCRAAGYGALTINPVDWHAEVICRSSVDASFLATIKLQSDVAAKTTLGAALSTSQRLNANVSCASTVVASLTAPSDLISLLPFNTWLEDTSNNAVLLVEVTVNTGGSETTRYLSSKTYTTGKYDGPVNTAYEAVVMGGIKVNESLNVDGTASMSWGDIQIRNTDGSFDSWIDDVWSNRNVRVYFGDVTWPRSKFQKIFDGVIADIDSKGRTSMSLKIRDKLELLNQPMSETKLGGTTDNKDRNLPLLFGECHNITPLLVDPANHTYMVHNGPINGVIEVRDNGMPVSFTENAAAGTFSLKQSPSGTITCSAQGFATGGYTNNPVELVKRIVQNYGPAALRYTLADIDIANFSAYSVDNDKPVGYFVSDRANVLDVCQNIIKSIGVQLTMSRLGLLTLCRLDATVTTTTFDINTSHMFDRSLQISQRLSAIAAEKVGFCKNWTVQADLQTAVVEEHKALYAEEWLTETVSDSTVATLYKLDVDPAQRDTYLLIRNDAHAEALRKLNLLKTPRNVYQFEGTRAALQLRLGQYVTLTANRFGLTQKRIGQIIGLSPDWMTGRVTVNVIVYGLAP